MTTLHDPAATHVGPHDPALTALALKHVREGTTDLAPSVLRVPLWYYGDPDGARPGGGDAAHARRSPWWPAPTSPSRNDFFVRDVIGTSVLVTRGGDGMARAFLNYCRHRGARPAEGCGNARRFTCPYHAWTYDTEGQLVGLPGARGFEEVDRSDARPRRPPVRGAPRPRVGGAHRRRAARPRRPPRSARRRARPVGPRLLPAPRRRRVRERRELEGGPRGLRRELPLPLRARRARSSA